MPDPFAFPALGTTAVLVVADQRSFDHAHSLLTAEIDAIDAARAADSVTIRSWHR